MIGMSLCAIRLNVLNKLQKSHEAALTQTFFFIPLKGDRISQKSLHHEECLANTLPEGLNRIVRQPADKVFISSKLSCGFPNGGNKFSFVYSDRPKYRVKL